MKCLTCFLNVISKSEQTLKQYTGIGKLIPKFLAVDFDYFDTKNHACIPQLALNIASFVTD